MRRPRLRSTTGCVTCKTRRKKCDEAKPKCQECQRLRLTCKWNSSMVSQVHNCHLLYPMGQLGAENLGEIKDIAMEASRRTAYHHIRDEPAPEMPKDFLRVLTPANGAGNQGLHMETEHLHDVLITGIFSGWSCVPYSIQDQSVWQRIMQLDHVIELLGHGAVSRLAGILSIVAVMQYLAVYDLDRGQSPVQLPPWLLPRQPETPADLNKLDNLFPWPAFRQRISASGGRYATETFMNTFTQKGARFIWPYESKAAIRMLSTGRPALTSEFILRINNVRSFAVAADFFNDFPEFRGEAPQLEPSPSLYTPASHDGVEEWYWQNLRRRHIANSKTPETELTFEPARDGVMAVVDKAMERPNH